ncbi:MAG: hypothetical protein KC656_20390 [Myxococcales bacterium]|nr:hypothetical protein [Myxococcales bacterium]
MSAWSPGPDARRAHPELAHLAVLDLELAMLVGVLTDTHHSGANGHTREARDQARSIVGVVRVLRAQIEAYRHLVDLPRITDQRQR